MRTSSLIAERRVDLLKPSGERLRFRASIGPICGAGRDFHCRVRFHGWVDSPPDIWGYDSLQAFILAVQLVHAMLADFVRRGGRVVWPGTVNDYSLDDFMCLPESPQAEPPGSRQGRDRVSDDDRTSSNRSA